jgi:heterodisulfide reductase subunit C
LPSILKRQTLHGGEKGFANEVIDHGSRIFSKDDLATLKACIQCGTCTGSCPSGRRTAWRIRQIFLKTLNGLRDDVLTAEDLWNCTTCYTCQERCPRKVKTTDIVRSLRNLAVREGHMREDHAKVCQLVFNYGHAVPINEDVKATRKRLGLTEIPPTVHQYPEALQEVLKILEATGFRELVERKGRPT